jgi:hypothetical protein
MSAVACAAVNGADEETASSADELASCPTQGAASDKPKADTLVDLMDLASDRTASSRTPMGRHFAAAAARTPTDEQLASLNDPKVQPPIPRKTNNLHLEAFPVTLYPSGCGPVPSDINQHVIGDCNGLTAFGSMAYVAPTFVEGLIKDNNDDTYTVSMFDPNGRPMTVTVDNMFLADAKGGIAAAAGKKGIATWATVLEKAVMKYITVYPVVTDIVGIGSEFTTPIFTGAGDSFGFSRGKLTAAQIKRVVKASLAAGRFISGGFGTVKTLGDDKTVTAHAYGVFISTKGDAIAAMRNPWGFNPTKSGPGDATADGVLDIPAKAEWAKTIDLRIIAPGIASKSGAGVWSPYVPTLTAIKNGTVDDRPVSLPPAEPAVEDSEISGLPPTDVNVTPAPGPGQSAAITEEETAPAVEPAPASCTTSRRGPSPTVPMLGIGIALGMAGLARRRRS